MNKTKEILISIYDGCCYLECMINNKKDEHLKMDVYHLYHNYINWIDKLKEKYKKARIIICENGEINIYD